MKRSTIQVWLLSAMAAAVLAGCYSQIPQAVTYEMSTQEKMQAAYHWEVLADDVADMVEDAIDDRDDLQFMPIWVNRREDRAFYLAFEDLLKSQLVSRGMQVSVEPDPTLVLDYRVLCVQHSDRYQRPPMGSFTALPLGVAVARGMTSWEDWLAGAMAAGVIMDVSSGYLAGYSDKEIIISVALSYNNRYVLHTSSIYYINDPDWRQYAHPVPGGKSDNGRFAERSLPVEQD